MDERDEVKDRQLVDRDGNDRGTVRGTLADANAAAQALTKPGAGVYVDRPGRVFVPATPTESGR